eukprot:15459247-Alexandrium_andersonii.AAC.1
MQLPAGCSSLQASYRGGRSGHGSRASPVVAICLRIHGVCLLLTWFMRGSPMEGRAVPFRANRAACARPG